MGHSHPVEIEIEDGLTCECASTTEIKVSGIDKQRVANVLKVLLELLENLNLTKEKVFAIKVEYVRRKEGKTAAKK